MRMSRGGTVAFLLVIVLVSPTVSAHGANSFAFIMREGSIQPGSAEVVQNDTLIFYNVASQNRTVILDGDSDGTIEYECITSSMNSSSTEDECRLWLDPQNWSAGNYQIEIYSNSSLWNVLNFTLLEDIHNESGPPPGYSFGGDEDGGKSETTATSYMAPLGLIAVIGILSLVIRRK
tara:strand:+ start:597 stop:1127 length:531 start_codon:yes stop_codon:yes gene_type:complete